MGYMKNSTRAAALLMFYFQSTPEGLLVSNQYIGVHTSADVGGNNSHQAQTGADNEGATT